MAQIHPSSIVDRQARLADDVEIGPGCVIEGPVQIGSGTRLIGHVFVSGQVKLGKGNLLYPNVCVGFEAQDLKVRPGMPSQGVVVGDGNVLREGVTIHAATKEHPTRLGDNNYLMCNSHLAHDVVVGNRCILANGALLGGHVIVQDNAILAGNAGVHQFCRLGRLCILSGAVIAVQDIPPFCAAFYTRRVAGLNLVGLRRAGLRQHIPNLRKAFRILFMSRHTLPHATELVEKKLADDPLCMEVVSFIRGSKRGITPWEATDVADDAM